MTEASADDHAEMTAESDEPMAEASADDHAEMTAESDEPMAEAPADEAAEVASDLDDAFAPVLTEFADQPPTAWTYWADPAASQPDQTFTKAVMPEPIAGRVVGPTPPDDLFVSATNNGEEAAQDEPDVRAIPPETRAANRPPVPSATEIAALMPTVFSTAPNMAGQPLVVRIELAIVDDSSRLRPVDSARRVGPWADEDVTVRHPEFEPRTHVQDAPAEPVSPAVADADVPWALPPLEPVRRQPEMKPVQQVTPPATAVVPPWVDANPTDGWRLEPAPVDPLTNLPAATFAAAPAAPAAQPAPATNPSPVFEPAVPADPPTAAPAQKVAANTDQSDLWFLASEPEEDTPDAPASAAAEAVAQPPSTMLTAGLTIAMAVVVIILVLVFIQLMTSLLH